MSNRTLIHTHSLLHTHTTPGPPERTCKHRKLHTCTSGRLSHSDVGSHSEPSAFFPQQHRKSEGDPFLLEVLFCLGLYTCHWLQWKYTTYMETRRAVGPQCSWKYSTGDQLWMRAQVLMVDTADLLLSQTSLIKYTNTWHLLTKSSCLKFDRWSEQTKI